MEGCVGSLLPPGTISASERKGPQVIKWREGVSGSDNKKDNDSTHPREKIRLSSQSIPAHIFHHFYPTLKPSFFLFTRSRFTNNEDKTQDIIVLVQDNKHRLHCTQDASSRWFNSLILPSSHESLDHQRSCRTPRLSPQPPVYRSDDAV